MENHPNPNPPTILAQEDDTTLVQLSGEYRPTLEPALKILIASFENASARGTVLFTRITDNERPKHFRISAEEADAFVEAWTSYKADLAKAIEARKQREQAEIAEAFRIAKEQPAIMIKERKDFGSDYGYEVSVPAIALYQSYIDSTHLLETVKECQEAYQKHLEWKRNNHVSS